MTTNQLAAKLAKYPHWTGINCLEVANGASTLYKIVNVHLDLTGAHLIIERVG